MTLYTSHWRRHTTGDESDADAAADTLARSGREWRMYPVRDEAGRKQWAVDAMVTAGTGPSPNSLTNLCLGTETR